MLGWILMRDDEHRQKTVNCSWFVGVEKRAVLAEAIASFGDPRMMDKTRCLQVMRKLLYLLNQGETFTKSEAAAILFSAIKLFRFEDLHLKRLFYLIAEELCPIAEEGDILESTLVQDDLMNIFTRGSLRPYAVRLLCRITNVPSSFKIEVYLIDAILSVFDCNVSSAGLVCALNLLKKDPGIGIKVCLDYGIAAGIAAANFCGLPKFHALCLFSWMQKIETTLGFRELAWPHIDKILSYELKNDQKHKDQPLLTCLVIRLITQSLINRGSGTNSDYNEYIINRCLAPDVNGFNHLLGNEMVAIEGLYSVMKLRMIGASAVVEAAIDLVRSQLPHYFEKPYLFLNVRCSMLKWSRIQNHLQPDDDDDEEEDDGAQLAKSETQGPAPATDNLDLKKSYLRKRIIAVHY